MDEASHTSAPTAESNAFMLAALIGGIPRVPTDAIAVRAGEGENARILHVLRRWERGEFNHLLITTGPDDPHRFEQNLSMDRLRASPFNLARTEDVHVLMSAGDTAAQMRWLALMSRKLDIDSITISAPPYHLPRAYLTAIKKFSKEGIRAHDCFLIPDPTPMSPAEMVPNEKMRAMHMMHVEFDRICRNRERGIVASMTDLLVYIEQLVSIMLERRLIFQE